VHNESEQAGPTRELRAVGYGPAASDEPGFFKITPMRLHFRDDHSHDFQKLEHWKRRLVAALRAGQTDEETTRAEAYRYMQAYEAARVELRESSRRELPEGHVRIPLSMPAHHAVELAGACSRLDQTEAALLSLCGRGSLEAEHIESAMKWVAFALREAGIVEARFRRGADLGLAGRPKGPTRSENASGPKKEARSQT